MSIKQKIFDICLNKKITRAFVDTHIHIPNMHRATFDHMLCIFDDQFGAFSKVNLALKCTKNPINRQNIYIRMCFINAHFQNCQLYHTFASRVV